MPSGMHGLQSTHSGSTACKADTASLKASRRRIRVACRAAAKQRDRELLTSLLARAPPGLCADTRDLDVDASVVLEDEPIPETDRSFYASVDAPAKAIEEKAFMLQDLLVIPSEIIEPLASSHAPLSEAVIARQNCLHPPAATEGVRAIALSDPEDECEHRASLDAYDLEDREWQDAFAKLDQPAAFAAPQVCEQQGLLLTSSDVVHLGTNDGRLVDSTCTVEMSMAAARRCAKLAAHMDGSIGDTPDTLLPLQLVPVAKDVLQFVVFFLEDVYHWNSSADVDLQEAERIRCWWHVELSTSPWAPQWRDKPSRGHELVTALEWLQVAHVPSVVNALVNQVEAEGGIWQDEDPSPQLLAAADALCTIADDAGIGDGSHSQASVCIIGDVKLCLQARKLALPYLRISDCRQATRKERAMAKLSFRSYDCVIVCACQLGLVPDILSDQQCWDMVGEPDDLATLVGNLRASYAASSQAQRDGWASLRRQPFVYEYDDTD